MLLRRFLEKQNLSLFYSLFMENLFLKNLKVILFQYFSFKVVNLNFSKSF